MTKEKQPEQPRLNQNQLQQSQLQQQQQQYSVMSEQQKFAPIPQVSQGFLSGFSAPASAYNEVLDASGNVRPHWSRLDEELGRIGATAMEYRCQQLRRMNHQNGIAYTAYGDPSAREKHLQLDPIPHLIPEDQWSKISAGLKQRAQLLNLVLADLFGARTLLSSGVLPHGVLFDHPHYQLAYQDLPAAGGQHLHFYSAKLVRLASGEWWVMSDRTDSPGGWGFALENRISISRTFPNEFRQANVKRLAEYFMAVQNHLVGLAKHRKSDPNIAILSAGPGTPSYFEDSYLARYLRYTLVQADDLVVRSGQVMLKTLAGLSPIDVILRRRSGFHLDPLELGGVAPGMAGVFQVIRDGNVAIANAPGSGMIESPIMMAFMPRICKALLGQELLMHGVATWWGGEQQGRELILDRIDEVNLVPAFRLRTIDGSGFRNSNQWQADPKSMTTQQRIDLFRRNPWFWVGQERVESSSTAVWEDGALRCGHFSMRAFVTASEDSWEVMPGGLARISENADGTSRSHLEEGGTKDVWVMADQPVKQVSLLPPAVGPIKSGPPGFLSSRMAENLCWLGRYIVRAETGARLLRSVVLRLLGEAEPGELKELPPLVRAMALGGNIEVGYAIKELAQQLPRLEQLLPASALDHLNPSSLRSQVNQVVSLSARVRERLSSDAWRVIQDVNNNFSSNDPGNCSLNDLLEITNTLIVNLSSFSGLISETVTRTDAYRFLNIGRRLESSLQTVGLLRVCLTDPNDVTPEMLEALLEISDSIMTYASRHYANFQMPAVLDLLVLDEMNPRSLAFQLSQLLTNIESLPEGSQSIVEGPIQKLAMDALQSVRMSNVERLSEVNSEGNRVELTGLFYKLGEQLPDLSTLISNQFFVHSGSVTQMIADEFGNTR